MRQSWSGQRRENQGPSQFYSVKDRTKDGAARDPFREIAARMTKAGKAGFVVSAAKTAGQKQTRAFAAIKQSSLRCSRAIRPHHVRLGRLSRE